MPGRGYQVVGRGGFLPPIYFDLSPLVEWSEEMAVALPVALRMCATDFKIKIPQKIQEIFMVVMETGNFPSIYVDHVMSVLRGVQPTIALTSNNLIVEFDLWSLGTEEDLKKGYHRGSLTADLKFQKTGKGTGHGGGSLSDYKVKLPYDGRPLYNGIEKRLEFWEAIVNKDTDYVAGSSRQSTVHVDASKLYDATLMDRVSVWGNSAPEWLILEFGSHEGGEADGAPPRTTPQGLHERLEWAIADYCTRVYLRNIETALYYVPRAAGPGQYMIGGRLEQTINNSARNILGQFSEKVG